MYLSTFRNTLAIEICFLAKQNIIIVTKDSAPTDAIHAPYDKNFLIRIKLNNKFKIAPEVIAIAHCKSFLIGIRYCNPKTLLSPMIKINGENIIIR